MKRLFQLAIAIAIALPALAHAEWKLYRKLSAGVDFYYAKSTITKVNGMGYVTLLRNTAPEVTNGGAVYESDISRAEFDCKKATFRMLHMQFYSERFGNGDIVHVASNPSIPQIVTPNSWMDDMYRVVCSGGR